ncbi:AraC-type DNA-binding protein [Chitinophaga terrae (ex Kim and Jung 2007)]|uniref:AraC-type DNA-binding protein n=1 Tax=Chitinophaga terrae (ex Kim and Jung 2007) TaxID=408074 RepID=A0A1H4EWS3_9BACT|nr:AraC family transcriptional regulator [Chitinophaga terrae (ex Kim and Jung 2007)]MDQ0109908.1 AraC-like DNA-binding protein [Chitinophaga terrae (ex Kim and Jung 2007)]GEP90678.1 hypothetical protein CTE07_23230 [Chitinophaga terrae (ex Kim and Jung 2007)]SEA89441.1 AraC-type DNA-binding protein [Chitinophaga terrae (ex Kim and Jung 2007)]
MTFYTSEIYRIRASVYANQAQLDTVIGIRKYIDQHFDTDLNLNLLSNARFVSKYHLLRLFKRYYGVTPKQYLTDKRIEKSKAYLREGKSVMETCFAMGFESPCSFTTLFKSRTGQRPSEFQKSATFAKSVIS